MALINLSDTLQTKIYYTIPKKEYHMLEQRNKF